MKIVILDGNSLGNDLDLSIFEELGEVDCFGFTKASEVEERIHDAEVIITNKVALDRSNLKNAKHVKLICTTGTGTNHIEKIYAQENGIEIRNVVNYSTESVAQHTFAMLFYLYENLAYYDRYVKSGAYINDDTYQHYEKRFFELKDKTWGIIGMGNIGKRVAQLAKAFGCKIIYYSTSGNNHVEEYTRVNLEHLLKQSDIVSIHAPLNAQTEGMISKKELSYMKESAYLLNLGRGKIIVEKDLKEAIENKKIAGVGLDVLQLEPMDENCIFLHCKNSERLYITPHIGWASVESRNRMIREVYRNIENFVREVGINLS